MRIYEASLKYTCVRQGVPAVCNTSEKVFNLMNDIMETYAHQETFWVLCLDRKNKLLCRHLCTVGTASSCLAHPREVFRAAILAGACAVVCVHNHPSGDPAPSAADISITRVLREAAHTIDIQLLDHVIIGVPDCDPTGKGFYSFREAGLV